MPLEKSAHQCGRRQEHVFLKQTCKQSSSLSRKPNRDRIIPIIDRKSALFKGTTNNPGLLKLVVKVHDLQMEFGFQAVVSHVSGFRRIKQEGDELSRGVLNEGVMNGMTYRSFIPFHESAFERTPELKEFIKEIVGYPSVEPIFLTQDQ